MKTLRPGTTIPLLTNRPELRLRAEFRGAPDDVDRQSGSTLLLTIC
jgi:hypothetical protein